MPPIDGDRNKVSILRFANKVLGKWRTPGERMSEVPKEKRQRRLPAKNSNTKDPIVETQDGRRNTRRSYNPGISGLWDADKKQRGMGRILQAAARSREAEAISERQRKAAERAARIKRLYQNKDFKVFWKKMQVDETFWINEIQKPQGVKGGLTLDYYYGFCVGNLKAIAELRDFIMGYQFKVNKDAIKAQAKV